MSGLEDLPGSGSWVRAQRTGGALGRGSAPLTAASPEHRCLLTLKTATRVMVLKGHKGWEGR